MAIVLWMLGIAVTIAGLVITAGARMPYLHMAIAALGSLAIAAACIWTNRQLRASGAAEALVASSTARHMGLIWTAGAIGLIVTYLFVLVWKEWWHFVLAFVAAAALCLFFAAQLRKDAESGRSDPTLSSVGRWLAIVTLVGMVATMAGLLIDGKMTRFLVPRHTDWAANNIFFFGALGLAVIAAHALYTSRHAHR